MRTKIHSGTFRIIRDAVIALALSAAAIAIVAMSIANSNESRKSENLRIMKTEYAGRRPSVMRLRDFILKISGILSKTTTCI